MSVTVVDARTSASVDLNISRVLQLREASRAATTGQSRSSPPLEDSASPRAQAQSFRASHPRTGSADGAPQTATPEISQIQAEIEIQREDIDRIDDAGYRIVSAIDSAVERIEREVTGLKSTAHDLKHALGGAQDDISSLKTELTEVKRLAQDTAALERLEEKVNVQAGSALVLRRSLGSTEDRIRKELLRLKGQLQQLREGSEDVLKSTSSSAAAAAAGTKEQTKEIASLRSEITQLRSQMEQASSKAAQQVGRAATSFPSRELDILTSNIAKIGNRASQVETLQMEFEILKGRGGTAGNAEREAAGRVGAPAPRHGRGPVR